MLDEGVASEGDCNVVTDFDLAMRLWVNGWHNALLRQQPSFYQSGVGSSHVAGPGRARCWTAQWESVGAVVNLRWAGDWPQIWRQVADLNRRDELVQLP